MARYEQEIEEIVRTIWPGHIVLVVVYHSALLDMVSHALQLAGYEPAIAATEEEAFCWLEITFDEGRYPAVVLIDLATPGIDGVAFLDQLRSRWHVSHPFPAVVVIPTLGVNVNSWSIQGIVNKPFHLEDLHSSIRAALSFRDRC